MSFKTGDRVAWHHDYATQHAEESVARASAVPQLPADHPDAGAPGTGQFGAIVDPCPANEAGTWFNVLLDGEKHARTLTSDEIVRIAEEEAA